MSYLLGYQKWRKLHESAKYGRLYEQTDRAYIKGSKITSIVIAGTSPTLVAETSQSSKYGVKAANGRTSPSLYEISLKEALTQNFGAATFVRALNATEPKDQFIILDQGGAEVDKVQGTNQKITFTVNQENLNNLKIQFAGNGVLCMHRASIQTKKLPPNSSYHVRLYMGHPKSPIPKLDFAGTDTTRFSVLVGLNVDGLISEGQLFAQIVLGACGYIASDSSTKQNIVNNLDRSSGTTSYSTTLYPGGDFSALKLYSIGILKLDGTPVYVKQEVLAGSLYPNEIGSMKDSVSNDVFRLIASIKGITDQSVINGYLKINKAGDKTAQHALVAINKYVDVSSSTITKNKGLIDTYFEQELNGIEEDLLMDLKTNAKEKTNAKLTEISKRFSPAGDPNLESKAGTTYKSGTLNLQKIAELVGMFVTGQSIQAKKSTDAEKGSAEAEQRAFGEGGTQGQETATKKTNTGGK